MEIRLEGAASLGQGETRLFEFPAKSGMVQGFVIRHGAGYFAYRNQCQHWPVPLDLGDGDFYHAGIGRITCKTHGAVYHPETGYCEAGPCARASLDAFPLAEQGGDLILTVPDA